MYESEINFNENFLQSDVTDSVHLKDRILKTFRDDDTSKLRGYLDSIPDVNSIKDSDGMSLLHLACCRDWSLWEETIKSLVEKHKCDITVVNKNGDTPLHLASELNNVGAISYFGTFASCDLSKKNNSGSSPLDIAKEKGHSEVINELQVLTETYKLGKSILVILYC